MNSTVDTHLVEKRFDAMSVQIEAQIDQAVEKIAGLIEDARRAIDQGRDITP